MTVPDLPPLHLLRAFHAVADTGSIRKGAEALGITHTVVSRHVRNLETYLSAKLFERHTTGAKLTSDGRQLYVSTDAALAQLEDAVQKFMPRTVQGRLRIWAMPGLAARWLSPRLTDIQTALRNVEIILRASETAPDLDGSEADLFIGFAEVARVPSNTVLLATPRMFPVASPQWLADHGTPKNLRGLSRLPLIHENDHRQWTAWFRAAGLDDLPPLIGPSLWNASLGLDAALSHQGIALATQLSVANDIAAGRLKEILDTNVTTGSYYLETAPDKRNKPHLVRFRAWLQNAM
ncbi:LysR substrate-binding domain-containing protein [Pelagibacterium sp.]|uniref:LysR substrate-binding domain-containing protein n=1 Tax=Pelagibacterium sp. TaxID=1967288 RepID=UPI003A8F47C0